MLRSSLLPEKAWRHTSQAKLWGHRYTLYYIPRIDNEAKCEIKSKKSFKSPFCFTASIAGVLHTFVPCNLFGPGTSFKEKKCSLKSFDFF